jgi:PD-(D/E)XK endonuclease
VVIVRCYSSRRTADGLLRTFYRPEEIDAFAAYCAELKRCYFLPIDSLPASRQINLRVAPSRNRQHVGINWAEDYEFTATLGRHQGAIAQLGERERGTLEVAGSSPAGSMEGARESPRPALFNVD